MYIVYILITVLILSFLITVHEFGHFIAAKKFDVKVNEFSIGMGPKIISKQGKETLYSLRLLPLGGFVSIQEGNETKTEIVELLSGPEEIEVKDDSIDPNRSLNNKKFYQKIIILTAGIIMNFIIGYLIILICFLINGNNFFDALSRSVGLFFQMFSLIFLSIKMLFTGEAGVNDLTGPIGIVQIVKDSYGYGLIPLLLFIAMISINLGIFNLLPIPALDGGQIALTFFDKFKRNGLSESIKSILLTGSYAILIALAIYIAINDINRLI